jgi:hypothetical protein
MAGAIAIVTGLGLVAAGAGLGLRKTRRAAVAADVRAQFIAALKTGHLATIERIANAYTSPNNPARHQAAILLRAAKLGDASNTTDKTPIDVKALYSATLTTGDSAQMRTVAKSLSSKYPHLSGALNDVASILGG